MHVSKNSYDTVNYGYQLLNCTSTTEIGSNYAILAVSKSGKKLYISSETGSVREYTGATAWLASGSCADVLAGSGGNGAGWQNSGGWRSWILD